MVLRVLELRVLGRAELLGLVVVVSEKREDKSLEGRLRGWLGWDLRGRKGRDASSEGAIGIRNEAKSGGEPPDSSAESCRC